MTCKHEFHLTKGGERGYCIICGAPAPDKWAAGVTEPGPVRMPTRAEIMQDARIHRWHPIATVPLDRPVLIGAYRRVAKYVSKETTLFNVWYMRQYVHEDGLPMNIHGVAATHWSEDVAGAPLLPTPVIG